MFEWGDLIKAGIIGLVVGGCIGLLLGINKGNSEIMRNAIAARVAYYTVDSQTGKTAFEWIVPTQPKKVELDK